MNHRPAGIAAGTTLLLATLLHMFTHALNAMLVPLYLLIRDDLRLPGVESAAMVVTVYGTVYAILSYPAGVLADRVSRKWMLGIGLLLNAIAIALMGFTHRYDLLIALAVLAGIGGTVFHPAANALVPEHFPKSPGMAIGLLGIGSGLGFFVGPQFAGWRARTTLWQWQWHNISNWQRPCVEMGAAGMVVALLFLLLAREARLPGPKAIAAHPALGKELRWRVSAIAAVLGCRDFAGVASLTLASIYLQKAMKLNTEETGLIVGTMMLTGVVANPLAVWLSSGSRRLPALKVVLILAGVVIAGVPLLSSRLGVLLALCLFQALQLGSYAMSDAAMLERVPANVRGRVVGLFLSLAGTFAGLSPFVMGMWTDMMGENATYRLPYLGPFCLLGGMMMIAAFSTPIIGRLGAAENGAISPLDEIVPATLEPV